uniref:Exonuclease domain-containing protein n=1 Tax=Trieres chinensis TaxID=1514140 RepID=A0A7S1ZCS3_TRICV|mmetsp:Transcript_22465/g.45472  ORF Transcript_22465/g.45472 Transcript_22465/m.45472 type:complete len:601 (+) Transcript_22465:94-1896(+)|eukprot:CAMPEP_0183293166 /NCGR_PEP_ID=MMETSP0160_2-20130417/1952_1 /TAXON_ID=2839 ORGANISM="Odontella Sinensis, Strain Grunow 1884" /NCGR_SAMPLE_ID=MMETSP0160_2 /ASSEMBLY_ACC=CAM_ASM_000250 /LENGTH=600 /DNA_ID=CAMNT_0025454237 /DNA_START=34 /DNA_END=1836 /DNA_ORIENTATION=-
MATNTAQGNIDGLWAALQAEAPAVPKGKPSPRQLEMLRAHKSRVKEFLAALSPEQRSALAEKNKISKPAKAERIAKGLNKKARSGGQAPVSEHPRLLPKSEPVRLGWDDQSHFFDQVVWFYSHRNRSKAQEQEDVSLLGGIDRRVFSNLFEQNEGLRVSPLLDMSGRNLMRWDFLGDFVAPSSENFFQAAKCLHEVDAKFIMNELSPLQAAEYGQCRMGLTDKQREDLIKMGADPDDFLWVESGATNNGLKLSPAWLRGQGGKLPRRSDWEEVKPFVMLHIVRQKFRFNPDSDSIPAKTTKTLLSLPSIPLLVEHTANDITWADGKTGKGSNMLGKAITQALLELSGKVPVAPMTAPLAKLRSPNSELVEYSQPSITKPLNPQRVCDPEVDYLCVLDFEATCNNGQTPKPQEIIEFPTLLVNTRTGKVEKEFHLYIKPDVHPTLSDFCTELTGITQVTVDSGVSLEEALQSIQTWLDESNLLPHTAKVDKGHGSFSFLFLTCGDWDLSQCLPRQLGWHNKDVPYVFAQWINVKTAFYKLYRVKPTGMTSMLRMLGMGLEGRHHSGIDDCRNIARICSRMLEDGWNPKQTSQKNGGAKYSS